LRMHLRFDARLMRLGLRWTFVGSVRHVSAPSHRRNNGKSTPMGAGRCNRAATSWSRSGSQVMPN